MSAETPHKRKKNKKEIKFGVVLNEEQKLGKDTILNNTITIVRGGAGSGKTLLACQCALDGLFRGDYTKIVIARPAVTNDEDLGFLPGDQKDKLKEFMYPIMDNFTELYGDNKSKKDKLQKHIEEEAIMIVPIGHMRGRSFNNAFVIIDEAQNVSESQMEMIVTRIGKGSKMVINGDLRQKDLGGRSGLSRLLKLVSKVKGLAQVELLENHRDGIVKLILNEWENNRELILPKVNKDYIEK